MNSYLETAASIDNKAAGNKRDEINFLRFIRIGTEYRGAAGGRKETTQLEGEEKNVLDP